MSTSDVIRGPLRLSDMSTLALIAVAPAGQPWCGSVNLLIVLVDQYRPDGATALVRRAATTTKCGGWATATTALGGPPDGTAISRRSRDSSASKQQRQDGGARTGGAAATQRHHAAADDGGSDGAGRWEWITGPAPVADPSEATNEQQRNGFTGGMIVPMVSWAR